jgi:hypothetical protein
VIPEDECVIVSTNRGEPLVLEKKLSLPGIAFENTACRIDGQQIEFLDQGYDIVSSDFCYAEEIENEELVNYINYSFITYPREYLFEKNGKPLSDSTLLKYLRDITKTPLINFYNFL